MSLRILSGTAMAMLLCSTLHAADTERSRQFAFSGPVQIAGMTLPGGTYLFKTADAIADRHIVKIFDERGSKLYGTFVTIPEVRIVAADAPMIMFSERPRADLPAVRMWFYPGNMSGEEFIYPKDEAVKIASATDHPVMALTENVAGSVDVMTASRGEVGRIDGQGHIIENTRLAAVTTQDVSSPVAVGTAGSAEQAQPQAQLPRTASDLTLIGVMGMLALAAGFAVSHLRRRASVR